jgi:acyl-CoA thioesterase-1
MSLTTPTTRRPTRRLVLAAALAAPSLALAQPGRPRIVTLLGDSITAGYGLPAAQALPARLQAELNRLASGVRVRGAGVSGDTTANGLARVNFSVQPDTALCVVALGGNDLLQGLDVNATEQNVRRIVQALKRRRIGVLLAGVSAPVAIGGGYARDFNALFVRVADAEHVPLYPDLLAGVARNPRLNQRDGIHPNAQGVQIIAQRLAPVVARALRRSAR